MKRPLSDEIISPQDLTAVLLEVRTYAKWFGQATIRRKLEAGKDEQPPAATPTTVNLLQDWAGSKGLDTERLDALLEALEDWQTSAPVVKLTLAAPPTNPVRRQLTAWCRANLADDALLTFSFNSTLLGGMVISYGSHIFDWSLRRQLLAARGNFTEVLRRV